MVHKAFTAKVKGCTNPPTLRYLTAFWILGKLFAFMIKAFSGCQVPCNHICNLLCHLPWKVNREADREDITFEVCSPDVPRDFPYPPCRNYPAHWRSRPQIWRKCNKCQRSEPSRMVAFTTIFPLLWRFRKVLEGKNGNKYFQRGNPLAHWRNGPKIWQKH